LGLGLGLGTGENLFLSIEKAISLGLKTIIHKKSQAQNYFLRKISTQESNQMTIE